MKFARAGAFGGLALLFTLLAAEFPSAGWILMIFALPFWLLFIVDLVRALRP